MTPFMLYFSFILFIFLFSFWLHAACVILAPRPGIKPTSLAVEEWSLNHWITREAPHTFLLEITLLLPEVYALEISFFFFSFYLFNLTIMYWFCHISKWIRHRYTCVPHPEPSSLLPPRTIPLGRPSAPAPSIQYRASNLDWRLVSYVILYMFQCHSPKSSHLLSLPQSPKDCSIH